LKSSLVRAERAPDNMTSVSCALCPTLWLDWCRYYGLALDLGLSGKVGLVTGGSRGIGRAIALRLADEGALVGICGRTQETLDRTLDELRERSVRAARGMPGSQGATADVAAHGTAADVAAHGAAADVAAHGAAADVAARGAVADVAAQGLAADVAAQGIVADAAAQGVVADVRVYGVVADVTQAGEAERFVDEAARALGGVDLVVANVGGSSGKGLLDSTPEDWLRTFDLNLFHAVRTIRAAARHMELRGGGSAVSIASISGWKPSPTAQYGAAKAAEIFLASSLAWDLAPQRIRVNTVSPGSIMFPEGGWARFREQQPERFAEFERREFPWGRLGTAEEVADVVAFVLSDRAAWINGTNIAVDGAQGRPGAF
jgi:3-oxoacyl-[acyl-carrier protein] reductase